MANVLPMAAGAMGCLFLLTCSLVCWSECRRHKIRREESVRVFGGEGPRVGHVFLNAVAATAVNAFPPCLFGFTITYGAIWFLCGTPKAFWRARM